MLSSGSALRVAAFPVTVIFLRRHPTEEVLSRLSYAGVKVLRTDAQSTILIRSDGVKMEVSSDYES